MGISGLSLGDRATHRPTNATVSSPDFSLIPFPPIFRSSSSPHQPAETDHPTKAAELPDTEEDDTDALVDPKVMEEEAKLREERKLAEEATKVEVRCSHAIVACKSFFFASRARDVSRVAVSARGRASRFQVTSREEDATRTVFSPAVLAVVSVTRKPRETRRAPARLHRARDPLRSAARRQEEMAVVHAPAVFRGSFFRFAVFKLPSLASRNTHTQDSRLTLPPPPTQTPVDLDEHKFEHLNALLDQTTIYSKFLYEQMDGLDEEVDAMREKSKKKQKKSHGKEEEKKNTVVEEEETTLSETQKLLPMMTVEMRDYQLKGVRWMVALYKNGLNGILADQMGLGKTVQTIGFLSHLRGKNIWGPYLILGPLSTLPNWVNEFNRFCPSFPVVLYHGSKQERADIRAKRLPTATPCNDQFPVIVTSFEIVMADRKFLQKYNFKYLVVDEGHRLKNFDCKLIRELKQIPAANKLLLTGTPLQNSLPELWSLLHFLLPDIFSSLSQFQDWFDFDNAQAAAQANGGYTDEATKRVAVVEKLHGILKPFLLRRLKGTAGRGFPKSGDTLFTAPSVTIHWSLHTSQVDCLLIQYTHTRQLKTDALFYPSQGDVESNLPRKKEIVVYAHMVKTQRTYNDALVNKTIGEMLQVRAFPCSKSASLFGPITGDCLRNTHHEKLTPIFFPRRNSRGRRRLAAPV